MAFAIVTGASKGIGKEIACALAERKIDLLLIARSENLLQELSNEITNRYKVKVHYKALDLSTPGAPAVIKTWLTENQFRINILINNAGYGLWGNFETLTMQEQLNMLELNLLFPVKLTYELLPLLKGNEKSYILNVSSMTAYQAIPYMAVYAGSKSFVVSFSRSLNHELAKTNISVSCLSPGSTDTYFMDRARMDSKKLVDAASKFSQHPKEVAQYAVKCMFNEKAEIIPGFLNQLMYVLVKFLPKALIEAIAFNLYKPH